MTRIIPPQTFPMLAKLLLLSLPVSAPLWGSTARKDSVGFNTRSGLFEHYIRSDDGKWVLVGTQTEQEYFAGIHRKLLDIGIFRDSLSVDGLPLRPDTATHAPRLYFRTRGGIRLTLGNRTTHEENPHLSPYLRKRSDFLFEEATQVHLDLGYAERIQLSFDYNTETSFASLRRKMALSYKGEETELIRHIEVGDIQSTSYNPLIRSRANLFGLQGKFSWGPLEMQVLAAKREGHTRRMRVRSGGGIRPFLIRSSEYDRNRHFFLCEFFARKYEDALSSLPLVSSDIRIERIEVWVSSRNDELQQAGTEEVGGRILPPTNDPPDNGTDPAYPTYSTRPLREWNDIGKEGVDHISVSAAVKLPPSAYHLNRELGTLSLSLPLSEDRVLVVAYQYRYRGKLYTVGRLEREEDSPAIGAVLATRDRSPRSPVWRLMMKNVYALPRGERAKKEGFRAEVRYQDYRTNTSQGTLPDGSMTWSSAFGWDRTDESRQGQADGLFDYLEGVTVDTTYGTLFLPYRYPFITVPKRLNETTNTALPVYEALYDEPYEEAIKHKEKDRFILKGEYAAFSRQSIPLGATDIAPGGVRVSKGGKALLEGIDYRINYTSGDLTILTEYSPTDQEEIEILIDERNTLRKTERTLLGWDARLRLGSRLSLGTSWYLYDEDPRMRKIRWGAETMRNSMVGIHSEYFLPLTTAVDNIPYLNTLSAESPSYLKASAAYAFLHSDYRPDDKGRKEIILEDFDEGTTYYDLIDPHQWTLGSLPSTPVANGEKATTDTRALLAWYRIDPRLLRDDSPVMPWHLRENAMERSQVWVREIPVRELFPDRENPSLIEEYLPVCNISYYPNERGPYSLKAEDLLPDGSLRSAKDNWAAMMRPLPLTDFSKEGILYLEGWMMVPYLDDERGNEGTVWIELGHFSDEILPGQGLAFESGLPSSRLPNIPTRQTYWGRIPLHPPRGYFFDFSERTSVKDQDVGLNGLSSAEEALFPLYSEYLRKAREKLAGALPNTPADMRLKRIERDPAGDDYSFYLGEEWDRQEAGILTRYKYICGIEGNSCGEDIQGLSSVATREPEAEDLLRNYTKNQEDDYFRFRLNISKEELEVGRNHITAERSITVRMPDGSSVRTRWVKIRIPITDISQKVGDPDWHDIRSMRMIFCGFERPIHLRLASLRLVGSRWDRLDVSGDLLVRPTSALHIETVGVEEDGEKSPVNYVLPPHLERESIHDRLGRRQMDERSLSLRFPALYPNEEGAVYHPMNHDLKDFSELSVCAHAEALADTPSSLYDDEAILYLRLGRDYTDNYYEASLPLRLTPPGKYRGDSAGDREQVWPQANKLIVSLREWTHLKQERNGGQHSTDEIYERPSSSHPGSTLRLRGDPTLSDIRSIVIGIRSATTRPIAGEVWVNELSVCGYRHSGGHAAMADVELKLSDLTRSSISLSHFGAGFGDLDSDRRSQIPESRTHLLLQGRVEGSKLIPSLESWQLPMRWRIERKWRTPLYDPHSGDLLCEDQPPSSPTIGTYEYLGTLTLPDWHVLRPKEETAFYHPSHFRFSLHHLRGFSSSKEISSHTLLRSDAELTYHWDRPGEAPGGDGASRWALRPQSWLLTNKMNRYLERSLFPSGESQSTLPRTLSHHFRWDRSLRFSWQITPGLSWQWRSATGCLVEEPRSLYEKADGDRLRYAWSDSVLLSLVRLGTPLQYEGYSEWRYLLPSRSERSLRSLRGTFLYGLRHRWDRGISRHSTFAGHRLSGQRDLDARMSYDLSDLLPRLPLSLDTHWRYSSGGEIPSLQEGVLPLLGVLHTRGGSFSDWAYRLGFLSEEKYIPYLHRNDLLVNASHLVRPSTFYHRYTTESSLSIRPLKGLSLRLDTYYHLQTNGETTTNLASLPIQRSGRIRMSTLGLGHFFDTPTRHEGYHTALYEDFHGAYTSLLAQYSEPSEVPVKASDLLIPAFVESQLHRQLCAGTLPSPHLLFPGWHIEYNVPLLRSSWRRYIDRIVLKHDYRGTFEVEDYRSRSDWHPLPGSPLGEYTDAGGSLRRGSAYDLRSASQRDDMSPLLGISLHSPYGLTLDAHLNRRRSLSLLPPVSLLLEQYRWDTMYSLRWRHIPTHRLRLLSQKRSGQGEIALEIGYTSGSQFILSRDLVREDTSVGHSFRRQSFKSSLDYSLSSMLTLRGFYEWDRRIPLVSSGSYPVTTRYYGLMVQLQLQP